MIDRKRHLSTATVAYLATIYLALMPIKQFKMFKKIFAPIILLVVLVSCNSKSAYNYSEKIAAIENSLEPEIVKTEDAMQRFFIASHFDSISIVGGQMEQKVEDAINKIKTMPAPSVKEADNYKNAAVAYFEYIKSVYTAYREYGSAENEDVREEKRKNILEVAGKKQDVVATIQSAQKKFAKANGFKIK